MQLSPAVPDTQGPLVVVMGNSQSNHTETVGLYLALVPPGGASNPGGCSPMTVMNLGAFTLLPLEQVTVRVDPPWQCLNPAAVAGLSWTLKAIADIHNDDFASCTTITQVFNGACSSGIANDDDNDFNNTKSRARPKVDAS